MEANASTPSIPPPAKQPRPLSNVAQIVQAICSAVTLTTALVGVMFLYRQATREETKKTMEVMGRLYAMDNDIDSHLLQYPALRPLFYRDPTGERLKQYYADGKDKRGTKETREMEVLVICDRYGNMFDYMFQLEQSMNHTDEQKQLYSGWTTYFETHFWRSKLLRAYFTRTEDLWGEPLKRHIKIARENETNVEFQAKVKKLIVLTEGLED